MPEGPEAVVARQLQELQADRERSAVLSGYVAALIDEAGWGVEQIAGLLGASRQSVSKRRKQGRELAGEQRADVQELPLPQAPAKEQRTRSGLRIPDADEITARESAWVRAEVGGAPTATELPARLKVVASLLQEVEGVVDRCRSERARLAWILTCFDPRAGQGLQKAGHWQPDEFFAARAAALAPAAELKLMGESELRTLARARAVEAPVDVESARVEYYQVTVELLTAQARRRAATEVRDALVRQYVKRDANGRWKGVTEVAGWIGRSQSQVTQICDAG
ncbi:hypothetical protein LWF15_29785 [Kineosporia rhizophila]|uniref:hypothetical protein n=1 Tax=Kineosporia rhizophila TaxID=84633 RepID=UPI001E5CFE94|nr:hypothetical protein [Kineosporia rhizophila]MCE0539698.1 hypothetical protein [Kineosporia rhizophila]